MLNQILVQPPVPTAQTDPWYAIATAYLMGGDPALLLFRSSFSLQQASTLTSQHRAREFIQEDGFPVQVMSKIIDVPNRQTISRSSARSLTSSVDLLCLITPDLQATFYKPHLCFAIAQASSLSSRCYCREW